jgi:acylglycerol lipase
MLRRFSALVLVGLLQAALAAGLAMPAAGKVVRQDHALGATTAQVPVYLWQDTRVRPQAMVLAIHGLTMHGKVFDATARHLASQRMLVAAPDLRGYGAWYAKDSKCKAKYATVEQDLVQVARSLRESHPGVPLFVAGESLGGTVAVRLAGQHPELVDGLILSAPALRYRGHVNVRTVAKLALLAVNPTRRLDTSDYIRYFSNDSRITEEVHNDPLRRKRMGLGELIASCLYMSGSAQFVDSIPVDMPVLVMQGQEDQMIKRTAVELLERKLKSSKRTIHWLPQRGHILLETAHVDKETLDTLSGWLRANCAMRTSRTTATVKTANQS